MPGRLAAAALAFALVVIVPVVPAAVNDVVPCGALALAPAAQDDAGSARDASRESPVAGAPGVVHGCVDDLDLQDWFVLDVPLGEAVVVALSPPSCSDFDLVLADERGRKLTGSFAAGCAVDIVARDAVPETRFLLGVLQWSGGGAYALDVHVGEPRPVGCPTTDDLGSGRDARADLPVTLADGAACLDTWDEADEYVLDRADAGAFSIHLTATDCGRVVASLHRVGSAVAQRSGATCGDPATVAAWSYGGERFRVAMERITPGVRYEVALVEGGAPAPACHPQDDGGSGRDARPDAPVALAGAAAGCVDAFDARDAYSLVAGGARHRLDLVAAACADLELVVRDAAGALVALAAQAGCAESVEFATTPGAAYDVLVVRRAGEGAYDLASEVVA